MTGGSRSLIHRARKFNKIAAVDLVVGKVDVGANLTRLMEEAETAFQRRTCCEQPSKLSDKKIRFVVSHQSPYGDLFTRLRTDRHERT